MLTELLGISEYAHLAKTHLKLDGKFGYDLVMEDLRHIEDGLNFLLWKVRNVLSQHH